MGASLSGFSRLRISVAAWVLLVTGKVYFTGVTLVGSYSDKQYAFAPFETVVTEADEAHFNHLIASYQPLDYTGLFELEDGTSLSTEAACLAGGGNC